MCPQKQRRMLNSLVLTSLSVNSYNPVIDQFVTPLAHRPCADEELRSKFCFLGKFDILSPDEIERLVESDEFDYSNEFIHYAEDVYATFFTS